MHIIEQLSDDKFVVQMDPIDNCMHERILRGVDAAIACAKDNADEARETAYDCMNSLGEFSSKEDSERLQNKLNDYASKMEEADRWEAYAKYYEQLKEKLNEDVEVEQ